MSDIAPAGRARRIARLRTLAQTNGAPGHEHEVKAAIRRELDGVADLSDDAMGSLIAAARGNASGPTVLLAAHMDEVAFQVRAVTPDGFIRFYPLGDWWAQVLLGQRVVIQTPQGDVPGVVGAIAPHLLSPEQRQRPVPISQMFIDVGAFSAEECRADLGIRIGAPILPVAPFTTLRNGDLVVSKALDDRLGCALIIELLHALAAGPHPNRLYGAFTVREEIGRPNSALSGWDVAPDVCFVLEVGLPADTPAVPADRQTQDRLGGGVTLVAYDGVLLPHAGLFDFVASVAEETGIACQRTTIGGSAGPGVGTTVVMNDVPSLCVAVPVRYAHSHSSLMHLRDYEQTLALMQHVLARLDERTLAAIQRA